MLQEGPSLPQKDHSFADFLRLENIRCGLTASTWQDAIAELTQLLHENEGSFDQDAVIAACIEREKATSTVIAPRLAVPHARLDHLSKLLVAVGTSTQGIPFADEERGPVNAVILILTPKTDPGLYLQALAALSRELGAQNATLRIGECLSEEQIYAFFTEKEVSLPAFLAAHDVMDSEPVTLLESDNLKEAINRFCSRHVLDIPVVDEEGDLRGILSLEDLLQHSMPEHLLWMHDLSPILQFEPFAELLRHDRESNVADFMREDYVALGPNVPAIQLAKVFLTQRVRQVLVVEGSRLLGVVDMSAFIAKVFWA